MCPTLLNKQSDNKTLQLRSLEIFLVQPHTLLINMYQSKKKSNFPISVFRFPRFKKDRTPKSNIGLIVLFTIQAEAVQKPGLHVPYLAIANKEISIILNGIDVPFKEAKTYRRCELEQIIEKKNAIRIQGICSL